MKSKLLLFSLFVLLSGIGRANAQTPVVSLSGNGCQGNTLTVNSSITPAKIVWSLNGTVTDSVFSSWSSSATTVAGGNGSGSGSNQLDNPFGSFIDTAGNVYVVDELNNRVQKWAPGAISGTTVAGGNGSGSSSNQLNTPTGVFVDVSGNVYVADEGNNRIQKWTPGSTSGTTVAGGNGSGSSANQLSHPYSVYVDGSGNIYIADYNNARVQKWAAGATSGTTVAGGNNSGSSANQLSNPTGVYTDASGNIFVTDAGNNRIQKWAAGATSGTTVAGGNGSGSNLNQLNSPIGPISIDGTGNLYIADFGNNRIVKWAAGSTTGTLIAGGTSGSGSAQLTGPAGVGLNRNGSVYTTDIGNNRVQFFTSSILNTKTATSQGAYSATVTTIAGNTATTASVSVVGNVTPSVSIIASATNICAGAQVTFTATPVNGGTTPSYQWKRNGVNVGSNSNIYNTLTLSDNDVITCVMTSSAACATSVNTTSNAIVVSVNPVLTTFVVVSITPSQTICSGTSVTFTATATNAGSNPTYVWKKNNVTVGSNSPTYTDNALNNSDAISCIVTSTAPCASPVVATSSPVVMTVNPILTPTIAIASRPGNSICAGTSDTIVATVTNPGTAGSIQWKLNGSVVSGVSGNYYVSTFFHNADVITAVLTSNATCATATTVTSNNITMVVNGNLLTPAVTVSANPGNTICAGTPVTFTATPANGGTAPTYQWVQNGVAVSGATGSTFTPSTLTNGAVISVIMTSNATCAIPTTAVSTPINMTVNPLIAPTITITSGRGTTICANVTDTFTAAVTNGGTSPSYQWKKNGINVGTNAAVYIASGLANNDVVTCVVTSNASCLATPTATSNAVTITITPLVTPAVTITASATTVCAGTSVTFTAFPTNGGTVPVYQWKVNRTIVTGITGPIFATNTLNQGDTVSCLLISGAPCATPASISSNAIIMTVNPLPLAAITPAGSVSLCTGGSVLLSANTGSGLTYVWYFNGVATTNTATSFTAGATGSYTVLETNTNGCTALSAATTVTVNPIPTAAINPAGTVAICTGKQSVLAANTGTGYSYQWYAGATPIANATNPTLTVSTATSYSVKVTSGGCSATSAPVIVTLLPNPPQADILPAGTVNICQGATTTLSSSVTSGYSYNWNLNGAPITGATASAQAVATAGTYTVLLTGTNGCSTTSKAVNVVVNPLPVSTVTAGGPTVFCSGGQVSLTANASTSLSYAWFLNGNAIPSAVASTYTASATGNYTVVETNANGCTDTSAITQVTVLPVPNATVTSSGATNICQGTNVTLSAPTASSYVYQWLMNGVSIPGANSSSYTANSAGSYTVTIFDNGCTATSVPASVNVNPLPSATVTPQGPTTFCLGENVTLVASSASAVAYQWNFNTRFIVGANATSYPGIDSGDYSVTVTDANGCKGTSAPVRVIAHKLPTAFITQTGASLCTGAFNAYQWNFNYNPISGATNSCTVATQTGIYTVIVTDGNGCKNVSNSDTVTSIVGISQVTNRTDNIKIYPNPAANMVFIDAPYTVNISVFSMDGKLVLQKNEAKSIDISQLANGVYIMYLYDANNNLLRNEKLTKAGQ